MTLVDTSVWIEFLRQNNEFVVNRLVEQIEKGNVVAFSPVFGELLQGVKNDREESIVMELWNDLPQLTETDLFLEAGRLSHRNRLFHKGIGLIDCSILAACKKNNLEIWTLDRKLSNVAVVLMLKSFT